MIMMQDYYVSLRNQTLKDHEITSSIITDIWLFQISQKY